MSRHGVSLTLTAEGRLKVDARRQPPAELMAALRLHRDTLLSELQDQRPATPEGSRSGALPGHLTALIDAAQAGRLPLGAVKLASGLVTDLAGYVLAWSECWPHDSAHVLKRLEEAHAAAPSSDPLERRIYVKH